MNVITIFSEGIRIANKTLCSCDPAYGLPFYQKAAFLISHSSNNELYNEWRKENCFIDENCV